MKRIALIVLVVGFVFFSCDNENDTNGNEFTVSTNDSVSNDVATLGLIGTAVSSSNANVATVEIVSGKIKITSVSEGSAIITVSASGNNAKINITVSKTGSITVGTIVKYIPSSEEKTIVGVWVQNFAGHEMTVTVAEDKTCTALLDGQPYGDNEHPAYFDDTKFYLWYGEISETWPVAKYEEFTYSLSEDKNTVTIDVGDSELLGTGIFTRKV